MNHHSNKSMLETWEQIPWITIQKYVNQLQKRIYLNSKKTDYGALRKLQDTLLQSWQARLLAVRKVTQENQGKKTAGIDGIKELSTKQRYQMAKELKVNGKAQPVRRVWIPKPGREEKRPLGIPTMHDRALQMLVKLALEPEWEARFEPNSYGFRPGRNCHDAIAQAVLSIQQKPKYVLDADIAKCFDRIDHQALLNKLGYTGKIRGQIKEWLKAGNIDNSVFEETQT
jgi:RNA-directed DNA polymerase